MGVSLTKSSNCRVIIRSNVLPDSCVGVVTCCRKPIVSSNSRSFNPLGSPATLILFYSSEPLDLRCLSSYNLTALQFPCQLKLFPTQDEFPFILENTSSIMPALPDYPGVSRMRNESPGLPQELPNLPEEKDLVPLRRLSYPDWNNFSFSNSFDRFLMHLCILDSSKNISRMRVGAFLAGRRGWEG